MAAPRCSSASRAELASCNTATATTSQPTRKQWEEGETPRTGAVAEGSFLYGLEGAQEGEGGSQV